MDAQAVLPVRDAASPSQERPPRVLVADDQSDILQALALLLDDAGFVTDLVTSARDLVASLDARVYDLLLMDLNYTRDTTSAREGLSVLRKIQRRDPGLPVVVMTGWGTIDIAVEAMRSGAKSFIQKPWDDAALVEIVRREIADGRIGRSHDAQTAKEREEAQRVQRALLPWTLPAIAGSELAARWLPAQGVGGDCYDVLPFSSTRVGVSIADVIGKGVPAALLMSNLQAAVRAFAAGDASPADVCRNVNRLLQRNIASGKFVTFCYAVADTAAGTIDFCNAGHNPPIVSDANGRIERLAPTGLVLGVAADAAYSTGAVTIERGSRVVWFTDGLTEAESRDQGYFSDERLVDLVAGNRHLPASGLADLLVEAAREWSGDRLEDDVTVLVMAFP
jgi:sigma-B regulation protein RsbU (phosphoserine phosphatase)